MGSWVAALALLAMSGMGAGAEAPAIAIELSSRSLQPAELVVVTMSFAAEPADVRVRAFGKAFPTFGTGATERRALVGIDVEQRPGSYPLTVEARLGSTTVRETRTLDVRPKKFATRILTVSPDFVNPSASDLKRIERDTARLREAYGQSASEPFWQAPFVRPVSDPVNSEFGRRSIFNGEPRSRHNGTDFKSPAGTPIKAPNAGRILLAEDLYFTGTTVIIDHGLGLMSVMAHLSRLDVREGDRVAAGQVVGLVGATGRVTGAHLHWSLRVADARVDPLSLLAVLGDGVR